MKCAVVTLTRRGSALGRKLARALPECDLYVPAKFHSGDGERPYDGAIAAIVADVFGEYRNLILVTAVAVAVRSVAPLLHGKTRDPGVVAVDDRGQFAVTVLGGHAQNTNELACRVAFVLHGQPVVTTASEVNETLPLDLIGGRYGWRLEHRESLATISAAVLNGEAVGMVQQTGETDWGRDRLPQNVTLYDSPAALAAAQPKGAVIISDGVLSEVLTAALPPHVIYRPPSLVLGIGFNRGTPASEMTTVLTAVLRENSISLASLSAVATIDAKRDDPALLEFVAELGLPLSYFSAAELSAVACPSPPSAVVARAVGSPAVAEAAALLAAASGEVAVIKQKRGNVTLALARRDYAGRGKLYVVGTGPGDDDQLTMRAREVLRECDTVIGFRSYLKYIRHLLAGKRVISSEMRQELGRAAKALELAGQGHRVALVSGGDPGVYGMSAAVYERLARDDSGVAVEVVPGVPAFCASAARLGAPLGSDFAAVSLSDLLVPWTQIEARLDHAARAEFVIAIYNPRSRKRREHLARAREILLRHRAPGTPVAVVRHVYRGGEETVQITDLEHLPDYSVDMFTLLLVGNRETTRLPRGLFTPRGYGKKYL